MTSTNDIRRDLDDIGEVVLGDLDTDERARLAVQLRAAGEYDRLQQLKEAAPTKSYNVTPGLEYLDRERELRAEALYALWELERGVWQFFYEWTSGQLREADYERFPDADWTEAPSQENGFHEHGAMQRAALFLANYRAWKRYATEDVGVSLREFLLHPLDPDAGAAHVDRIEFMAKLADGRALDDDDVGGWATETTFVEEPEQFVEDLTEQKYQDITAGAEEAR